MTVKELTQYGLTPRRAGLFVSLALLAAFFEGFGLAMFLPLLQFIESQGDVATLADGSRTWTVLISVFQAARVPITLMSLVIMVLSLIMCRVLCMYFRKIYTAWLTHQVLHSTRTSIFSACLRSTYSFLDSLNTGHLINLATTEALRVRGYFHSFFECVSNVVVVAGYLVVLCWLSAPMTVLALIVLIIAGLLVNFHVRHTKQLSIQTTDVNQEFSFQLVERLSAFRLIKLTSAEEREINHLKSSSHKVRDFNYWLSKLNARVDLLLEPMVVLGGLIILYLAVEFFDLSLAEIGLFMVVLLRVLPLSKDTLRSKQNFVAQYGGIAAVRKGLEEMARSRESYEGVRPFEVLSTEIRFHEATFSYPGRSAPAVRDLSLTIAAGSMTALVGPSGAGKSTLIDLLAGLRRLHSGNILIDGIDITEYDLMSLRRGMAFVSQDTFIFNDTLKYNLSYARPEASDDEIRKAMDRAQVTEFADQLPHGWDTVLGERGTRLSGGQKQRLALARALLQNSSILILDEATSALDSEKETDIQEAIYALRRDARLTLVAIAHRLSTIQEADNIVVMESGRVVEQGRHHQLVHNADWYARVSSMQGRSF